MALDWSPFGGNPVPGDPGQVQALAQRFGDFVGQVRQQHGLLMDVHNGVGGIWMSPAGRAFSPHLGELPGRLQKLHTSYADAADALDAYWPELADAQSMATTALAKVHAAIQAQADAKVAQAQDYQAFQAHQAQLEQQARQQANQSGLPVTVTLSSYSPSPAVVAQTDQANQAYQAAMNLKDQAVNKAQTAAHRLSARLDDASKAGIQNPHYGFFGGLVHDAESAFDDVTHWVAHHVGAIETVAAVAALGPAGLLLTSDGRAMLHSALKAVNPVFEVVSGVCGAVSFGLAIVGFIPGIGEVADLANEGVMGVKTLADLGMLADGDKGAVENLEGDALGLVTGGESRVLDGTEQLLSKTDEAEELTQTATELRGVAANAELDAGRLGQKASTYENLAALNRFEGRNSLAEQFAAKAEDLRMQQSIAAKSGTMTAENAASEEQKVTDLQDEVGDLQKSSALPKEFSGYRPLSEIEQSGLGNYVGEKWAQATDALSAPRSYLNAGGNRLLTTVRLAKFGLNASEVAREDPELSKYVRLASTQPG